MFLRYMGRAAAAAACDDDRPPYGGRYRRFGGRFGTMGRPGGRGNVRHEILAVLADGPRHGYDVMLEIERRRGFRPSPGSIYPALQLLEDSGFVTAAESDGKRTYTLTDAGRAALAEHAPDGAATGDADDDVESLRERFGRGALALRGLIGAARQVARSGNPKALERAADVLDRARRELYTILADET